MRSALIALSLSIVPSAARGEGSGGMIDDPKVLIRIVQALEESDGLASSKGSADNGKEYSYHLTSVSYLGALERDEKRFVVATALFTRSSAKGSQYPPARGHGFVVILDPSYKIVSHAHLYWERCYLDGEIMMVDDKPMFDFSKRDPITRYKGWLTDDGHWLPYPFSDRISEAGWESGAFRKDAEASKSP